MCEHGIYYWLCQRRIKVDLWMNYLMLEKYYPNYSLKINFKVARKLFFFMKLPMSIHKPWQFFLNQCMNSFFVFPKLRGIFWGDTIWVKKTGSFQTQPSLRPQQQTTFLLISKCTHHINLGHSPKSSWHRSSGQSQ